jgi:hypothetical protein
MTVNFRRRSNVAITIIVAIILVLAFAVYDASLYQGAFFTGWILFLVMGFLALFRLRKEIPVLPLGAASTWMQWHIYAGWLVILLFAEHVSWGIPNGGLEITISIVFALVVLSGIVGLLFSQVLPPRLTRRGEEVIFERIPVFIAELRKEAEDLVLQSARETKSSTIRNFYLRHLSGFFSGPRNRLRHLFASRRPRFRLMNEIDNMERYLNRQEFQYAENLRDLVNKKDELDFYYALSLALKAWLLVHVPLTYSLLILAILHLVVVYAFGGGLS